MAWVGWVVWWVLLGVGAGGVSLSAATNHVLVLNGRGSYAVLPEGLGAELETFTIELWARWDRFGYYSSPLHFGDAQSGFGFNNNTAAPAPKAFLQLLDRLPVKVEMGPSLPRGEWVHLAATCGAGELRFYVNGVCLGTNAAVSGHRWLQRAPQRWLGRSPWEDNAYFQGALDEVRVWDRVLEGGEIQGRAARVGVGSSKGLVASWDFEPGAADGGMRLMGEARIEEEPDGRVQMGRKPVLVTGRVLSPEGSPVPAEVSLWSGGVLLERSTATTSGQFRLSGFVEDDAVWFEATHGSRSFNRSLRFASQQAQSVEAILTPAVSLHGKVLTMDGSPQSVAEIIAINREPTDTAAPRTIRTTTDRQGRFAFRNLAPGTYQVRCVEGPLVLRPARTASEAYRTVSVRPGMEVALDFRLPRLQTGAGWTRLKGVPGPDGGGIQSMVLGKDGELWIGTATRILRKTGGEFTVLPSTSEAGVEVGGGRLVVSPSGTLWMAGLTGIWQWDGARWIRFVDPPCSLAGITSFAALGADGVALGTPRGLVTWTAGVWKEWTVESGLPAPRIIGLRSLTDGGLWVRAELSHYRWKAGVASDRLAVAETAEVPPHFPTDAKVPESWLRFGAAAWATTRDGVLWLTSEVGFFQFDGAVWKRVRPDPQASDSEFWDHLVSDGERVWVCRDGYEVFEYDPGTASHLTEADGLPDRLVSSTAETLDGSIWVGTERGLLQWSPAGQRVWTAADGLPADAITKLLAGRSGDLWIGTAAGLSRWSAGVFHAVRGFPSTLVMDLELDSTQGIWASALGAGVYRITSDSVRRLEADNALAGGYYGAVFADGNGGLWLGARQLEWWSQGRLTEVEWPGAPKPADVTAVEGGMRNEMWVGTWSAGLWRMQGGEWRQFGFSGGIRIPPIISIQATPEGHLWCGTIAGLRRFDGEFWSDLGASRGIIGRKVRHLRTDAAGFLWVGTDAGVARYRSRTARPRIERIECAGDGQGPVKVQAEKGADVPIHAVMGSDLRVRWRVSQAGTEGTWTHLMDRTDWTWKSPGPGVYRVEAMALDADLNRSESRLLEVEVVGAWYRQAGVLWGAGTLGMMLVATLGFLTQDTLRQRRESLRLRRAAAEQERQQAEHNRFARALLASQEEERGRIAHELHDSLGQELLMIRNLALLGGRAGQAPGEALVDIAQRASLAIEEVRDISYGLTPQELDRLGLVKALEVLAQEMTDSARLDLAWTCRVDDPGLGPEAEISVFRVFQEALQNAVRHGHAHRIEVELWADAGMFAARIRDDGAGFDVDGAAQARRRGMGLTGMSERLRLLGGHLEVRSAQGFGTEIRLSVPQTPLASPPPPDPTESLS